MPVLSGAGRRGATAALGLVLASILSFTVDAAGPAGAAPSSCQGAGKKTCDTTAPTIAIATPVGGATVSGTLTIAGTAGDNVSVSSVAVAVDGGSWQAASGTSNWSWSWSTSALPNGAHTLAARATDSSGNTRLVSETVTVSNPTPDATPPSVSFSAPAAGSTVSGTVSVTGSASDNVSVSAVAVAVDGGAWQSATGASSWSYSWNTTALSNGTHTVVARATDSSGNTASTSETVSVSNSSGGSTWTSPEGVKIQIQTTTGGWTPGAIYSILSANARDLSTIGPSLTIVVQDQYPTVTSTAASSVNGVYTAVSATMQLDARSTSTFSLRPDDILTHEYGHTWVNYYRYLHWQGDWSRFLNERWSASDGSTTLATDSRTGTSYIWNPDEIAADDYRLLFGGSLAVSERNASLNQQIVDPRNEPGLADWFLNTWRSA